MPSWLTNYFKQKKLEFKQAQTDQDRITIAKSVAQIISHHTVMLSFHDTRKTYPTCIKQFWQAIFSDRTDEIKADYITDSYIRDNGHQFRNRITTLDSAKLLELYDYFFDIAKKRYYQTKVHRAPLVNNLLIGILTPDISLLETTKNTVVELEETLTAIRQKPDSSTILINQH